MLDLVRVVAVGAGDAWVACAEAFVGDVAVDGLLFQPAIDGEHLLASQSHLVADQQHVVEQLPDGGRGQDLNIPLGFSSRNVIRIPDFVVPLILEHRPRSWVTTHHFGLALFLNRRFWV